MIHYALRCAEGHGFDGWFKSSDGFEQQAAAGLVACPACGDTRTRRALMAPAVASGAARRPVPGERAPAAMGDEALDKRGDKRGDKALDKSGAGLPDAMRAVLQRIRAEIERTGDYVGDGFAAEARRIHRGEAQERAIYGESSDADAEALAQDGIEVLRIPWVKRADG